MSPERSPEPVRFPVDPAEFADDVRISWSKLDNNWILETEDEEFTYNASLKAWNPVVCSFVNFSALLFTVSRFFWLIGSCANTWGDCRSIRR